MDHWQRVESVFQEALQRAPADRDAWLREACAQDSDLHREVASLLACHDEGTVPPAWPSAAAAQLIAQPVSLRRGDRLGPYQIESFIAAGGMGAVYRARDTRLGRDVALKVLPDEFAKDPERVRRSEREARLLASLNHPNIAAIYDLSESEGHRCLVLEFVEGQTLGERLKQGRLSISESIEIARQIAEALETAHENGIIHRDLKPGNVMITASGRVKVLDFGIAKMLESEVPPVALSSIDTPGAGVVLGTPSYMSPEQARGKPADRRTDIWAFGVVLYELLTGRRAFQGETRTDTLAAIVEKEPDWTAVPSAAPARIQALLRRCLQKDARRRLQAIGDARVEIEELQSGSQTEGQLMQAAQPRARLAWIVSAVTMLIAAAAIVWALRPVQPAPELHVEINTPPTTDPFSLAISPNGQKIAFVAISEGPSRLWVHSLDSGAVRSLPATDGALGPFWSPDGRSLGFFAEDKLKRIDIDGVSSQTLADVRPGYQGGGSWNRDGTIILGGSQIARVSTAGDEPTALTSMKGTFSLYPQFLPDGHHFIYYARGSDEVQGVYLGQLDAPQARRLLDVDSTAVYALGHLLFLRQTTLFAQKFDPIRLELSGDPFQVAEGVLPDPWGGIAVSASAAGPIVYRTGSLEGVRRWQYVWLDRSGKEIGKLGDPVVYGGFPSISPDGRHVALADAVARNQDIWLLETARGALSRFTFDGATDAAPVWSPDSRRIAWASNRNDAMRFNAYLKAADNPEGEDLLIAPRHSPTDWSPNEQFLLSRSNDPKTGYDIWAVPMGGDRKAFPVVQTNYSERDGQFSPSGKWIAYQSNESGSWQIYAKPFTGIGGVATSRVPISLDGGTQVRWARDGKELFYIALDGRLMAVPIQFSADGQQIQPGPPVPLFASRVERVVGVDWQQYMVSSDGRFLMRTPVQEPGTWPITMILNWKPKS